MPEQLALRHSLENKKADGRFMKYLSRVVLAVGFAVSLGCITEAVIDDEFRVPGILAGVAVGAAVTTMIPAERQGRRDYDEAVLQLEALDNRG
jgi:hypothetical protein